MNRQQLLTRLDRRWRALVQSYAGLSGAAMTEPGVVGDWSVKDILAHVTTWEEEALKTLPLIMEGLRLPRYGGIDRFNAQESARRRGLTPGQVLQQMSETHRRLVALLEAIPESYFATETRFRRLLRLNTYGHYPEHTASILAWRRASGL